jgi:hypothetical protein
MGLLGTRWHRNCNAMSDAAKISPCVNSTCAHNAILSLLIIRDCKTMGDSGNISPRVASTCAHNAILSLLIIQDCKTMGDSGNISPHVPSTCAYNAILSVCIIHLIPHRRRDVAIDNPSFVLSVSCRTNDSHLWNDMRTADIISHAETLQNNSCQCFGHWKKFRGRIQVTRVFRYCRERQG